MKVIAHRGDSGTVPENTILAFQSAMDVGADIVEFDVQITKDAKLVIFHDRDTLRTAGVDRRIVDMTLEEVKHLDVGRWKGEEFSDLTVPTLQETLETLSGKRSMILEIKPQGSELEQGFRLEQLVLDALDDHGASFGGGYVSVRTVESLEFVREHSSYPVGLMQKKRTPDVMNDIVGQHGIDFSQIRWRRYSVDQFEALKDTGTKVTCFFADTKWEWGILQKIGVYGVLTNYPGNLRSYLGER